MLVLIDESGCPGFELGRGSSPYFAVAMVVFADFLEAERASFKIAELRRQLSVREEFKFSHSHPNVRNAFFNGVCGYDFLVRAIVVDKASVNSGYLKQNPDNFYNYFLKVLIDYDAGALRNASIKIDGRGTRSFVRNLKSYLRNQIIDGKIKKINLVDSKKDNLIQLADMMVGVIAKSYGKDPEQAQRWINLLRQRGRIDNIWQFK